MPRGPMELHQEQEAVTAPPCRSGRPPLPRLGVLAVNPPDAPALPGLARDLGLREEAGALFNSRLWSTGAGPGGLFVCSPAVGAPMATLCLEQCIARGAREMVLYGWCGSLDPALAPGDILLPTWCLSGEGVSRYYGDPARPRTALGLRRRLAAALKRRLPAEFPRPRRGPVWSTDAPLRETRDLLETLARQGLRGVDMECSALCSVAAFRGVDLAACLLVSDTLLTGPWRPAFVRPAFRKTSRRLLRALCRAALELTRENTR